MRFERHYSRDDIERLFGSGFSLPEEFLWGVSNSAYQVEGGYNGPGEPCNNWAEPERKGKVERTGEATRFWTEYPKFIELAQGLGLNGFRMGVDWSRVQPTTLTVPGKPPPFDRDAIERYAEILGAMMAAGLEPMVTLHMFTHPAWLGQNLWLEYENVGYFTRFAREVAGSVNDLLVEKHRQHPVKYWITINEPNVLAIVTYLLHWYPHKSFGIHNCGRAWGNMLAAHCRAYDTLHRVYEEKGWQRPYVTFNTGCNSIYLLEKVALDLVNARINGVERKDLVSYLEQGRLDWEEEIARCPDVRRVSWVSRLMERALAGGTRFFFDLDDFANGIEAIYESEEPRKMDYVAIDLYDPFFRNALKAPTWRDVRERRLNLNAEEWEWVLNPRALYHFLKAECINAPGLPVVIVENGMAYKVYRGKVEARRDGATRDRFLQCFIYEAMRALKDGVPLKGYFHWTLIDTYEWGRYEPRFGLYTVDRTGRKAGVSPVDTWGIDAGKAYREIATALVSGDRKRIAGAFLKDVRKAALY